MILPVLQNSHGLAVYSAGSVLTLDLKAFYYRMGAMTSAEQFLQQIELFLQRTGMTATNFGFAAVGDPNFVGDLRRGRKPSLSTVDRVNAYMKRRARCKPRAKAS